MPLSSVTTLHNRLAQNKEEGFLSWEESSEGPAHEITWTLKCKFRGDVQGTGKGPTKAEAKEEAAKQALQNMGFN